MSHVIVDLCTWVLSWGTAKTCTTLYLHRCYYTPQDVASNNSAVALFESATSFLLSFYDECKAISDAPPAVARSPPAKQPAAAAVASTTAFNSLGPAALAGSTTAPSSPFGDAPVTPPLNGDPADAPSPTPSLTADRSPSRQATRVKSFQLQDDDLLALSENVIASSQNNAASEEGAEQAQAEGDFSIGGPSSKVAPTAPMRPALPSDVGAPYGALTALALGARAASGGLGSDYGTPRSPGGSEVSFRSQDMGSDYFDVLSPKSADANSGKVAWAGGGHPLSALGKPVSEADEEEEGGRARGADVSDVLRGKDAGGFKVLLQPDEEEVGKVSGKKRRGFLKRMFGRKK